MWCFCRLVYLPSSYLYGKRFVGPITPFILQLREELFTQPYENVNWKKARHQCAKVRDKCSFTCNDCTYIISLSFFFKTRYPIQESTNRGDQSHRLLAGPRLKPEQALYRLNPLKLAPEGIEPEISVINYSQCITSIIKIRRILIYQ